MHVLLEGTLVYLFQNQIAALFRCVGTPVSELHLPFPTDVGLLTIKIEM